MAFGRFSISSSQSWIVLSVFYTIQWCVFPRARIGNMSRHRKCNSYFNKRAHGVMSFKIQNFKILFSTWREFGCAFFIFEESCNTSWCGRSNRASFFIYDGWEGKSSNRIWEWLMFLIHFHSVLRPIFLFWNVLILLLALVILIGTWVTKAWIRYFLMILKSLFIAHADDAVIQSRLFYPIYASFGKTSSIREVLIFWCLFLLLNFSISRKQILHCISNSAACMF